MLNLSFQEIIHQNADKKIREQSSLIPTPTDQPPCLLTPPPQPDIFPKDLHTCSSTHKLTSPCTMQICTVYNLVVQHHGDAWHLTRSTAWCTANMKGQGKAEGGKREIFRLGYHIIVMYWGRYGCYWIVGAYTLFNLEYPSLNVSEGSEMDTGTFYGSCLS